MRGRAVDFLSWLLALVLFLAWAVAFPPWPDDWDGLGFLASIRRFDLASFGPHPPGYPVYVALLKVAGRVFAGPIDAARAVALLSGLVTLLGLRELLDPGLRPRSEPGGNGRGRVAGCPLSPEIGLAAAAVCATPLVFRAFSGVGSEAPALALAAMAAAGVSSAWRRPLERASLVGIGVGLGLGVRLSWAPFYLPFFILLPPSLRLRALGLALLACAAWTIPLVLLTGPSELVALGRAHLAGHITHWGGTSWTEPDRARSLLRDFVVDGFGGDADPLGIALVVVLALAAAASVHRWLTQSTAAERRTQLATALLLTVPYLVWVTFGQNLRQQPRHVLPLVALAAYGIARAARASRPHRVRTSLFGLLAALMVARTATDAFARRTIPPPGAQLLAYLRENAVAVPIATTAIFAGASGRFLDGTEWQAQTHAAGSVGDALLAVARMDRLPRRVLVTSELAGLADADVAPVASFCRPPRLDRRLPCMQLYAVDPSPSPASR